MLSKNNNDGFVLDQNNNDVYDEKPAEKTIFIDRIVKLALDDKIFTDQNVLDELKTILLAVNVDLLFSMFKNDEFRFYPFVGL